jgi:very-short-patch-repair endonuclease
VGHLRQPPREDRRDRSAPVPPPRHRRPPHHAPRRRDHPGARHPGHHARAHPPGPGRTAHAQRLERAVHEAEYRRLTSPLSLDALLTRHPKRRGTAALRTILNRNDLARTRTKTELEIAFLLAFVDTHHIERPKVNEPIGPYTVDALWPEQRLIAELDSRQAHHTTRAFEDDRARDRDLQVRGYRVLRITWRHLHEDDATIAAQLRALLARATTPTAP